MDISARRIELTCAGCGRLVGADVWRIVDLGQKPELKQQVLRGQLNVANCPHCGRRTFVATPLAYHDPEKELFFCILPSELGLSGGEQDKAIGELTNLLMDSLPPEKRKAYLFQPQTLFSIQRLQEEILRADGLTEETEETLVGRGKLIQELLAQSQDEAAVKALVEEHKDQLDYEFFLQLTASIDQAKQEGSEALAEQLASLRSKLVGLTSASQKSPWEKIRDGMSREELIEELLAQLTDDDFKTAVAVVRPLLDYQFFQDLTAQLEAAQDKGDEKRAEELTALRTKLLDLTQELDMEAMEALEKAAALLREIVESEDMKAAVEEKLGQLDGAFLSILEANIAAAREEGQEQLADKLDDLKAHAFSLLEARLPPELVLINRLLAAEGPEERRRFLHEREEIVSEQFLELLKGVIEDLREQGHQAAQPLADSVEQVEEMLQARGADTSNGQAQGEGSPRDKPD